MVRRILRWFIQNVSLRWGDRFLTRLPRFLTAADELVIYNDVSLMVNTGEEIGKRIFYYGAYEPEQEQIAIQYLQPGKVFFDIGANMGVFSLLAAKRGVRTFAFEPSRKVGARLRENIGHNRMADNITVVPKAVALQLGSIEFYETRTGNWGVGRIFDYNPKVQSEKYLVHANSLDEFVGEYGIPDLIKIDVEGAEWLVLNGASQTLREYSSTILIEFHPQEIASLGGSVEKCVEILTSNGFQPRLNRPISHTTRSWQVFSKG
jgi:FkbM family methyltransferase